jgi:hypothetical protein
LEVRADGSLPTAARSVYSTLLESLTLLTESEVQRSFRNLFKSRDVSADAFEKAESLLEELRNESPLRHRLSIELEELRKMHTAKV